MIIFYEKGGSPDGVISSVSKKILSTLFVAIGNQTGFMVTSMPWDQNGYLK